MPPFNDLNDAKSKRSSLVDQAAAGEEIVIARSGIPWARLVPLVSRGTRRASANAMRIETIAADFDARDREIEMLFVGDAE